ncbi:MAG: PQQ-binding-like beta-propeller repeat protein [Verrucomicrobiota bacterium]
MKASSLLPLVALTCVLVAHSHAVAENWPNWRGPIFNGSSQETELPTQFSPNEGVTWKTQLPGEGASTPIVWENSLFLTSANDADGTIVAMRVDTESGEILWTVPISDAIRQDNRSTYAGASASTDGERVIFFSGTGDLVALDFDGNELWARNIQEDEGDFAFLWTFSSSPLLYDGTLYLQVLQRDVPVNGRGLKPNGIDSYLLAMDPETGATKWKHVRPSDAIQESREAFSTPIPILHDGRPEILIAGGDALSGHDPKTGRELWRWSTYNPQQIGHWRLVPSPIYGEGIILVCAPKGDPIYAIEAGGSGNLLDTAKVWTSVGKEVTADVPTPLYYDGYFYILNGRNKFISCVHPTTGKVLWMEPIPSKTKLEASPTGADGKIYFMSHLGEVFVYAAGPEGGGLLHQTTFGGREAKDVRASIVPANGALYLRTEDQLYQVK